MQMQVDTDMQGQGASKRVWSGLPRLATGAMHGRRACSPYSGPEPAVAHIQGAS